MSVSCTTTTRTATKADAVIVFAFADEKAFRSTRKALIKDLPHVQPIMDSGDFTGKKLSSVTAYVGSAAKAPRVILVGLGSASELTAETVRRASATGVNRAAALGCKSVAIELPSAKGMKAEDMAHAVTEGAVLSQYNFHKYKTIAPNDKLVTKVTIMCDKASLS